MYIILLNWELVFQLRKGGINMQNACRVVKVSYSNELSSDSAMWVKKYIESALLTQIIGKDITKLHLLLMKKGE